MNEIKNTLQALYKQRDDIDKQIGVLEKAQKIIKNSRGDNGSSSKTDLIKDAVINSKDGLEALQVSEKTGVPLPTTRSILSRLKSDGELGHDKERGVYTKP